MSLSDVLSGAVALNPDDITTLVEWAKAVEASDGKLHSKTGFGLDTTGYSVRLDAREGADADVEPGDFHAGWVATPALGVCPACGPESPFVTLFHADREIGVLDCVNCRTRYSPDALPEDDAVPDEVSDGG